MMNIFRRRQLTKCDTCVHYRPYIRMITDGNTVFYCDVGEHLNYCKSYEHKEKIEPTKTIP